MNVDPANLIAEVSVKNNNACGDFYRRLDGNGDGLTDYEGTRGMRVAFPSAPVTTNPFDDDSDNDTIVDSDEPEFETSALNSDTDYDRLNDGFELEIGTDPLLSDTDGDQYSDYDEYYNNWFGWYSPLVYEKHISILEIARDVVLGAVLGEFGAEDNDSISYLLGWMLSGIIVVGDIRDIAASIAKGDGPGTLLNAVSLIPGYGDAAKVSATITKFVAKHPHVSFAVILFIIKHVDDSIDVVKAAYKDIDAKMVEKLNAKGFSDDVIVTLFREGIDLKRFDDILTNSKIYEQFPGLPAFVREKLTRDGEILKDRVTFDVKKMTAADAAGRSTAGYLANLKGTYTEYLASVDITGTALIGVKRVNKGGIDYAAKEGDTLLKIVEAKARQSLSVKDLNNYIKTDKIGNIKEFNVNYVIKDLGEDYFNPEKNPNLKKQFVLYLNGPNSQDIMKNLNLPASLPYRFKDSDDIYHSGTIEIIVKAVNK